MELPKIRPDIAAYAKLALTKAGYVAGQVEVTSKCFQKCRACESWRDDLKGVVSGTWSLSAMQMLCEQLNAMETFEHLTLTGGDPQHWPQLPEFLQWFRTKQFRFRLQCNTALTQDVEPAESWFAFDDVCVSLDAVDPVIYNRIRGDKLTHPEDVLRRMRLLQHRRIATRTTVMTANIDHAQTVLDRLEVWNECQPAEFKLRKAVFLAVIGPRDEREGGFWEKFKSLQFRAERKHGLPTSFSESVPKTREFLESADSDDVPCYAGNISFHVKANGDWYPCCLAGGEAITTYPELRTGNYFSVLDVRRMLDEYRVECHYGNPAMPCSEICQWKQLQVNVAGHVASKTTLSMP